MSARQVRVLLTGGIGAGKSSVGRLLRARGALVIDADEIGHQVLEPGGEAYDRVVEAWPSIVVDGAIDRSGLADIVFRDSAELERLEGFTHTAIRQSIADLIEQSVEPVVVVEVPLPTNFMGTGWLRVVVDTDPEVRVERLLQRGMEVGDVQRRLQAQPTRSEWLANAEAIIENSSDARTLEEKVDVLWDRLTAGS